MLTGQFRGSYRAVAGQLQGSCETALSAASGAACLADASQPITKGQALLVFMNMASTALHCSNDEDMKGSRSNIQYKLMLYIQMVGQHHCR